MKCQIQHLQGSKKGQVEEITASRISMGRNPENTLAFDPYVDADCSGNHAALEERDDGFIYAVDLNSRNGTFVNGAPVPPGPAGTVCPPGSMVQLCKAGPALKLDYVPGKNRLAPAPKPPPPPPEPGSKNGLIIGLAIGAVLLILLVVLLVVLLGGGDKAADEKQGAAGGPKGDLVAGDAAAQGGAGGVALEDAKPGEATDMGAAGGGAPKIDLAAAGAIPAVPKAGAGAADDEDANWLSKPGADAGVPAAGQAEGAALPAGGYSPAGTPDAAGVPMPDHAVARMGQFRIACEDAARDFAWVEDDVVAVVAEKNGERVHLYDVASGEEHDTLPGGYLTTLPAGKHVITTRNADHRTRVLDATTGRVIATAANKTDYIMRVASGGARFAAQSDDGWTVFDASTGAAVRAFGKDARRAKCVGLSPDGKAAAFAADGHLIFVDVDSGAEQRDLASPEKLVQFRELGERHDHDYSADLSTYVCRTGPSEFCIVDLAAGAVVKKFDSKDMDAARLAPDGKRVVLWGRSDHQHASAKTIDIATGKQISTMNLPAQYFDEVAWVSPGGTRIAFQNQSTAGLYVYDLATGKEIGLYAARSAPRTVALSRDGRRMAAGLEDGTIIAGKTGSGRSVRACPLADRGVSAVAFTDDKGGTLRAIMPAATLTWAWEKGEQPSAPVELGGGGASDRAKVRGAITADGRRGAQLLSSGGIGIFDLARGGAPEQDLATGRQKAVTSIAISPDGKFLGSTGGGPAMRNYEIDAKTERTKLEKGEGSAICFSGDGKLMAFAVDEKVFVFDRDKKKRAEITLEVPGPDALALSFDGALLAAEGEKHSIVVYDVVASAKKTTKAATLTGHTGRIRALAFDGEPAHPLLASGSSDKSAVVWGVPLKSK